MTHHTNTLTSPANHPHDDFDDLEAALLEAVEALNNKRARSEANKEVRTARLRLQDKNLPNDERAALLAKIEQWEQKAVWSTAGIAAMFQRHSCSCCGEVTLAPVGYYKYQTGRQDKRTQRWVKVKELDLYESLTSTFPRSVIFQDTTSDFCIKCLDLSVFDITKGEVKCLLPVFVEQLGEDE